MPNNYGLRNDGTKKDIGFLGELKRPDGRVSTELSIGTEIDGKETEIPTLVPTLNDEERNYLLSVPENEIFTRNPNLFKQIHQKAVNHAISRIKTGKSPFYTTGIDNMQSNKPPTMPTAQEIYDQQLLQDDPFDYNKAMDEYKGGRKPLLDAIMSNYKKPEPQIDPEQEKKAKYGAALSDTFSSLAQMFAHGQGARVQRNQGASSTEKTNARLQAIRDKYEQDLTQYQTIKGNAAVQDLNMYFANRRKAKDDKLKYAEYLAKQAQDKADRETKAAIDKRDFDYKVQQDNKSNKLKERELAIQAQRASKDKPDKFEGIVINANEADGKAAVDATGKKVIPYKMTKPEIANIANTAKRDVAFIKENPNVYIDTVDRMGKAVRGLTSDENLAQMYAQWQYDKRYKKPQVAPEVKQFMPWLPKVEQQKTATQPAATKPTQSNFSLNGVKSR